MEHIYVGMCVCILVQEKEKSGFQCVFSVMELGNQKRWISSLYSRIHTSSKFLIGKQEKIAPFWRKTGREVDLNESRRIYLISTQPRYNSLCLQKIYYLVGRLNFIHIPMGYTHSYSNSPIFILSQKYLYLLSSLSNLELNH